MMACPCGGKDYASCCEPFHRELNAPNAEALMRSRYSAYVLKLEAYLLATWHVGTRPTSLNLSGDAGKWLGLEIKQYVTQSEETATVEFVARYKLAGRAQRMHELSRFVRVESKWFYVEGDFL
ncbi:MAG: YchJ family metal-binding protein [Gallionella sp.]